MGTDLRFRNRYRLGFDVRASTGGDAGNADSYSMTLGADPIVANLGLHSRSTRYTNDFLEGWLHSLSVSLPVGARVHLDLHGGVRNETNLQSAELDNNLHWLGLDLDMGRQWYLLLSAEWSQGDLEAIDQYYLSLSYRF